MPGSGFPESGFVLDLKEKISLLPHSPGVYRYYDSEGNIIYIGKARDLSKRVSQYFVDPGRLNTKTRILVSKIADIQYSVVDTEADALLLENNLIKQYKPKYNILLKDSKTYPWICITDENFPRIFLTRKLEKNGSSYYGPYSSVMHARALLDFFRENYPLRSCKYRITPDIVQKKKIRPCLDLHLKRCLGCCTGGVSAERYASYITEIKALLTGGAHTITESYREKMKIASDMLDFESAQFFKSRVEALEKHYSKSIISSAAERDCDVFSLVFDDRDAYGNFLRIRGGAVIQSLNLGFRMNIEESQESVLSEFIAEIQSRFGELSKQIIVPFLPDVTLPDTEYRLPVRGDKLALLELSVKNAREYRFNSQVKRERSDPSEFRRSVLAELQKALGMSVPPRHIECFDNSNLQGTNPVAACVVFRDGVPSKGEYRKFKVKTVVGADDYATMKEIVSRRFSRLLAEAPDDLPDLVVIDGGRGQLNFAWQALCELGIQNRFTVVGLAERLEEIIRTGDPYPLFLDRDSQAFKLITHVRDEAHRFGITFHRKLRSKSALDSVLRRIKGVGPQTEQRLLMHYGSVAMIAAASLQDLSSQVGGILAARILETLNSEYGKR